MKFSRTARLPAALLLGVLLRVPGTLAPAGEEPAPETPHPGDVVRPELKLERTLFSPTQPIRVRFLLFNAGGAAVEVPVPGGNGQQPDSVNLPTSLIFGTSEQPALVLQYEQERPTPIDPPETTPSEAAPAVLRLAPHAGVGAEIELTEVHRPLRYSGRYRLQWQPLGSRGPTASVVFRVEPRKDAVMVSDYGKITFSLFYDKAPRNVENFLELVRERFYDGKTIHRLIPGFVIQGGSPDGSPTGIRPDGKLVPAEFHPAPFELGTLAMARKPSDPDSASCQFFITLARLPELDGKYTVIGQASDEESLRTLQRISELPTDANGRPLRPLVIRFFTLVDAPEARSRPASGSD